MKEIFCTVGPSSLNRKFLKGIAGMNVKLLRINLSHTDTRNLKKAIKKIKKCTNIPICVDTEGAQIRTVCGSRKFYKINKNIKIDNNKYSKNLSFYPNIFSQIKINSVLDIGFEDLKIKIINKRKNLIIAKVLNAGYLDKNKGVHIVNQKIKLPPLTKKDIECIEIARKEGVKNFALSFTNSPKDVSYFNNLLVKEKKIFKIETKRAVQNIKSILNLCDAILIDRGDLSKDISLIKIPFTQRKIQRIAKKKKKKVYVATNLLESMVQNSYPTRAELNDIYNCLELGADGLVLAAETAIGKWPIQCVKLLSSMIKNFYLENQK